MKMIFSMIVAAPLFASAQTGAGQMQKVPPSDEPALVCPSGTRVTGGKDSGFEAKFCTKAGRLGEPVMHGPYLGLYKKSGKRRVDGAYVEGKRNGLWTAYDEQGRKLEEFTFDNDRWNGKRTQWIAGTKILEENWVAGKRQGLQREWVKGREVVTEFKDDAPLKKELRR